MPGEQEPSRDQAYAEDIFASAKRISSYLAGTTLEQFLAHEMLQDAVLRRLTVIGEAATCLSPEFKRANPEVPWKHVVGFRNLVVHRYWTVDLEIVWRILVDEVPILVQRLAPVVSG
jgi:uncharacterized protein with HEPN domain